MSDLSLTIIGNLTRDPELKTFDSGRNLCKFTVASTPRVYRDDEWTDGETTFMDCQTWGAIGDNIAATFTKGLRVIVAGRLRTERWEKDGDKRSKLVLDVEDAAPSLRWHQATPRRAGDDPSPHYRESVMADDDMPAWAA